MLREFLPCIYRQYEYYDRRTDTHYTRHDVLELLPASDVETHEDICVLTKDCHQYHVSLAQSSLEKTHVDAMGQAYLNTQERTRVFLSFYQALRE